MLEEGWQYLNEVEGLESLVGWLPGDFATFIQARNGVEFVDRAAWYNHHIAQVRSFLDIIGRTVIEYYGGYTNISLAVVTGTSNIDSSIDPALSQEEQHVEAGNEDAGNNRDDDHEEEGVLDGDRLNNRGERTFGARPDPATSTQQPVNTGHDEDVEKTDTATQQQVNAEDESMEQKPENEKAVVMPKNKGKSAGPRQVRKPDYNNADRKNVKQVPGKKFLCSYVYGPEGDNKPCNLQTGTKNDFKRHLVGEPNYDPDTKHAFPGHPGYFGIEIEYNQNSWTGTTPDGTKVEGLVVDDTKNKAEDLKRYKEVGRKLHRNPATSFTTGAGKAKPEKKKNEDKKQTTEQSEGNNDDYFSQNRTEIYNQILLPPSHLSTNATSTTAPASFTASTITTTLEHAVNGMDIDDEVRKDEDGDAEMQDLQD